MHSARTVHRENFEPTQVEFATLLSVKAVSCEVTCGYCPLADRYDTAVEACKPMNPAEVLLGPKAAQATGAARYCMAIQPIQLRAGSVMSYGF